MAQFVFLPSVLRAAKNGLRPDGFERYRRWRAFAIGLDGLPLGIELAAARISHLPVAASWPGWTGGYRS